MKKLLETKPILSFILLTFAITFTFWFLPVILTIPKDIGFATLLIGVCGPLVAGYFITVINSDEKFIIKSKTIFFTVFIAASLILFLRIFFVNNGMSDVNGIIPALKEISFFGYILFIIVISVLAINASNATNRQLKENYISSLLYENNKFKWYLIGIFVFISLSLVSYFIGRLVGIDVTDFIIKTEFTWFVGFFCTLFFLGGNEEFGWRGFLQKEMQKKHNPLITSIIISFLWSLWHLPLHYNGFYSTGGFIDLLPRFIFTLPLTIIFTWLYNKSSYSILAVVLLHAMNNNVSKGFGSSEIIYFILVPSFAIFCIINDKMWKKRSYKNIYEKNQKE